MRSKSGDLVIARDPVIFVSHPTMHKPQRPITRSPVHRMTSSSWLINAWNVVVAVLREIFDESAYDRFLARTHARRSIASYREFRREQEAGTARRPRCC